MIWSKVCSSKQGHEETFNRTGVRTWNGTPTLEPCGGKHKIVFASCTRQNVRSSTGFSAMLTLIKHNVRTTTLNNSRIVHRFLLLLLLHSQLAYKKIICVNR